MIHKIIIGLDIGLWIQCEYNFRYFSIFIKIFRIYETLSISKVKCKLNLEFLFSL